jgi:drug/metabolite transporter (DMT)-like permease
VAVTENERRQAIGARQAGTFAATRPLGGEGNKTMMTTMFCIRLSTACGVTGQLLLKKAMLGIGVLTPSAGAVPTIVLRLATSPLVIIGLSCYVLGSFFWLIALSRAQLSFAYPFVGLSFVLIFAASWYFYGESINIWRLAGMVSILIGVLFVSRS